MKIEKRALRFIALFALPCFPLHFIIFGILLQVPFLHSCYFFTVSTSTFDYASALVSYCIVGVAILSGTYDHLSPAAISAVISKVL